MRTAGKFVQLKVFGVAFLRWKWMDVSLTFLTTHTGHHMILVSAL